MKVIRFFQRNVHKHLVRQHEEQFFIYMFFDFST